MRHLSQERSPGPDYRKAIIAVFIAALVLRVVYLIQSLKNPMLAMPVLDEGYYVGLARMIAGGQWLGEPRAFFMDPLYGYALALAFALFGENLDMVRFIQILLDSFNVFLIYALGVKVLNRRAGLLAAVLYAVYKVSFFYTLAILKTTGSVTLLLMFTLTLIHTAERGGAARWLFLGFSIALLTLFRGNLLLLAPLGFLAYMYIERPKASEIFKNAGLLAGGLAVGLSIGAARNWAVTGEMVFLNSQAGRLLYASNNPQNLTGRFGAPSFSHLHPVDGERDFHIEAERRLGKPLSSREVSAYWKREAFNFLMSNPRKAAALLAAKVKWIVGDYEVPVNMSVYMGRRFSSLAQLPLPTFAIVLALGAPGLLLAVAWRRNAIWFLVPVAAMVVTMLIFYASSRFRLPAVPFLILGAGFFIDRFIELVKTGRMGGAAVLTAMAAPLLAISLSVLPPPDYGNEDHQLAKAFWNTGKFGEADRIAQSAAVKYPDQSRFRVLLGMSALARSEPTEAIMHNLIAIGINGRDADAYHNIGLAYIAQGKTTDAVRALKRAQAIYPRIETILALARAYEAGGDAEMAKKTYEELLEAVGPKSPLGRLTSQKLKNMETSR